MKCIFSQGKEEIWKKISIELNGRYLKTGFCAGSKVLVSHENWNILLDCFYLPIGKALIPYTRFRAPFQSTSGFRFLAYNQGFFARVGKMFGMQDFETGFTEFDNTFILQGNKENQVQALFGNEEIRSLMLYNRQLRLEIKDDEGWLGPDFPESTDELICQMQGELRDEERLKALFQLFSEVLSELERLGEATAADPGIRLA